MTGTIITYFFDREFMDGKGLLARTVQSVQEMRLKIGDSAGSVSLYYPYEGDFEAMAEEFRRESSERFPGMVLETLLGRVRVTVPEEECERIAGMPMKETMEFITSLTKERIPLKEFLERVSERYPDAVSRESGVIDFDWILSFPEDRDVYCLSEEMGQTTYHRFTEEDFLALGFELPSRSRRAVPVAPFAHPVQQRDKRPTGLGQRVFDAGRYLLVELPVHQPVPLQLAERVAESLVGHGGDVPLHLVEPHRPELHEGVQDGHLVFP